MSTFQNVYDSQNNIVGCKMFNEKTQMFENVPISLCKKAAGSQEQTPRKMLATSKFVGFMGIDGSTESYIPLGVAALGGVAGFMLHKKYPKFGMAGKVGYIAIGAAAGYFITKQVVKKKAQS